LAEGNQKTLEESFGSGNKEPSTTKGTKEHEGNLFTVQLGTQALICVIFDCKLA